MSEGLSNPESLAEASEPLGRYWIVIVLWSIAFAAMIAFEIIAAIFKR